jgi:probable F420-dependent oxidoreductase
MRVGVTFPQSEIGSDPDGVRAYAQAAEDMGYRHLLAYDHVVGADRAQHPDFRGPYDLHTLFHEPFVLFGYLAGLTASLEFVTGIVILPQRQTVLVAKQASEVDVLSTGRLRLGVGIGWNQVEYEALGQRFTDRGRRSEEQIELLRRLFTEESVTFEGHWHTVHAAGINPMPVQRPIPIWIGGGADETLRRVARLGDGWFPQMPPDRARGLIEQIHRLAAAAGRDPAAIGIEARVSVAGKGPDEWIREVLAWRDAGATHLAVNTMNAGLDGPDAHIEAIRAFRDAVFPALAG